jgi:hypothetical protein
VRVLGIDPGHKGALAFLDLDAATLVVEPMPVITLDNGKTYTDEGALSNLVGSLAPTVAFIEDVYSSPQMGVVSAFSFGEGKGVLKGVLAGLGVERRYVSPAKWKADLGTSSDKDHTKALARRLFPRCRAILRSEGKCEAALIGLWGALSIRPVTISFSPAANVRSSTQG